MERQMQYIEKSVEDIGDMVKRKMVWLERTEGRGQKEYLKT